MTTRPVVLVLCGLPGAGKSSLASGLAARLPDYSIEILDYDAIYTDKSLGNRFEPGLWHTTRESVHQSVRHTLDSIAEASTRHLIVLDDNMYYRSMRKRFWQLAQTYRVGLGQVFVDTSLETCRRRNAQRDIPVPSSVFNRMAALLEVPQPESVPWEHHSIQVALESNEDRNEALQRIADFIQHVEQHPEAPTADLRLIEQSTGFPMQEKSRESNRASSVHCLDGRLRKLVSLMLQDCKESKAVRAKQLNDARKATLQRCRDMAASSRSGDMDEELDLLELAFMQLCGEA
ncbi:unnamed protein product [Aphanomyces euteiches]